MPSVPGMGRGRARRDDARLIHAHILRVLAANLPPGALTKNAVRGAGGRACLPSRRSGCPAAVAAPRLARAQVMLSSPCAAKFMRGLLPFRPPARPPAGLARAPHRVCAGVVPPHHLHHRPVAGAAAAALLPLHGGAPLLPAAGGGGAAGLPRAGAGGAAGGRGRWGSVGIGCALGRRPAWPHTRLPRCPVLPPPHPPHPPPALPQLRKELYEMFSLYCEEAQAPGQFRYE